MMEIGSREASSSSSTLIPLVIIEHSLDGGEKSLRRKMQRVQPALRLKKHQQSEHYVYDPMVVSLGPYHHGKPHLQQVEEYKQKSLAMFLSGSSRDEGFFHSKIIEQIHEIRSCYTGVSTDLYDDEALCMMILRDSCFLICHMMVAMGDGKMDFHMSQHRGASTSALMDPDIFMLENQIPYSVIKLLIESRFGENEGKSLLRKYFSIMSLRDRILEKIPWEDDKEEEPLHLLEALQKIFSRESRKKDDKEEEPLHLLEPFQKIFSRESRKKSDRNNQDSYNFRNVSSAFPSVTELKAKGIDFKPSSHCLAEVHFESHAFYGQLKLPIWFVSPDDKVFFANMIAFETSPGTRSNFTITSYINFMKTLIESSKDVKELKEKGILFSNLGNDEEVVKVFKEIDTCGVDSVHLFADVKMKIENHCNSKAKTWMAELIHTYFRNPWTVIALLVTTFILVLTFIQTYYTVRNG